MENAFIKLYKNKRHDFFKWRSETSFAFKIVLASLFACLTALGALVRFHLPFTPVPVTLQVFFVLLSGVALGKWYGGLSQTIYIGLGAAGIPWFTAQGSLTGVTGGYLIGFIFAAILVGWLTDKDIKMRSFLGMSTIMLLAIGIIYTLGALQLSLVLETDFYKTMSLAVFPFIAADIVKALVAASIGCVITPKEIY